MVKVKELLFLKHVSLKKFSKAFLSNTALAVRRDKVYEKI